MNGLIQDLRLALRQCRRHPGFTAVAVITLALATGTNTALFTLINAVMLRLLPVRQPEQLVELLSQYPGEPRVNGFSWKVYEYFRDHNHVFSELLGTSSSRFHVSGEGLNPESVDGEYVTGNFFPSLGVTAAVGRLMSPDDDQLGGTGAAVAVISWSYWKGRFNCDRAVVGKRLIVEGVPTTIVGVAPAGFFGLEVGASPDFWMPAAMEPLIQHPSRRLDGSLGFKLMGQLKAGLSIEQTRAEMAVLDRWRVEELAHSSHDPLIRQLKIDVESAATGFASLRDHFKKPLSLLMLVVGLLLLIACGNLATMLLARGAVRQHELALRVSLGAGRSLLLRQSLLESFLLSSAGTLVGFCLAVFGSEALLRVLASGRQIIGLPADLKLQLHTDSHTLLFTAAIAIITTLLFGLAPAYNASTAAPISLVHGTDRQTTGRLQFGKGVVIAQLALSMGLLSLAAIFVGYLAHLQHTYLGFERDHVLLVKLDSDQSGYDEKELFGYYRQLLDRLQAIPGVRSAAVSAVTPLSGAGAARFVEAEGHSDIAGARRYVSVNWVTPKYFETYRTPFRAGADFTYDANRGSPQAIINEAMAHYYFGHVNPIGKHVWLDNEGTAYEIVGVVADAHYAEIREAPPRTLYINDFHRGPLVSHFALRTSVDPLAIASAVRRTVQEVLPSVSIEQFTTLDDQINASIVPERLVGTLSGVLGAQGAALAGLGVFGLLGYTVSRRTREIGIRMAMGSSRAEVIRIVLRDAMQMTAAGLAIGTGIAFWGTQMSRHFIAELPASNAVVLIFGAIATIAIAVMAAYLPARRAAKVDPVVALRYE